MSYVSFSGQTLDDLMRSIIGEILDSGQRIVATKGSMRELFSVMLELKNPRARLSRTETRGKPFSCLGELCWYLAGTDDINYITYYLHDYEDYREGDVVYAAYGPRIFNWNGIDQFATVASLLMKKNTSRQAVIQIFDARDIVDYHAHVPCTCTIQFSIREGALNAFTSMRSNDISLGFPHDVFAFTMLQEILAHILGVDLGTYKHAVGSLHLYDRDEPLARQFLDEGWQSTTVMPAMPTGDPWPAIDLLLRAEAAIRMEGVLSADDSEDLDPYWADLIRLLEVYRCSKDTNPNGIEAIRERMVSDVYRIFIEKRLADVRPREGSSNPPVAKQRFRH